jgi:hypothetical protein
MEDALKTFHDNKSHFVEQFIRQDLNIPKFHSLNHYLQSIKLLGTTDNYNTEMFERLHIDFAKEGWRASNQRDAFPQMIKWLSRQEKMYAFEHYVSWLDSQRVATPATPTLSPSPQLARNSVGNLISLPKYPTQPRRLISRIEEQHFVPGFSTALKEYLNRLGPNPTSSRTATLQTLPFQRLDVYHTFKFHPPSLEDNEEECDVIKAAPAIKKSASRFDTAVILDTDDAESTGLIGLSCLVFNQIPLTAMFKGPGLDVFVSFSCFQHH